VIIKTKRCTVRASYVHL